MSKPIKIKRGLNIPLKGSAEKVLVRLDKAETYGVKPTDFPGLVPKLNVAVGDKVRAGSPLFHDKYRPNIVFSSPVSGEVVDVRRGERRVILEYCKADRARWLMRTLVLHGNATRDEVIAKLLKAGGTHIRQRPLALLPILLIPKIDFHSGFDTSPLAPDLDFVVQGEEESFQAGVDAIHGNHREGSLGVKFRFSTRKAFDAKEWVPLFYWTSSYW